MDMDTVDQYFDQITDLVRSIPRGEVRRAIEAIRIAGESGSQVFIFGNGGSAATASHMACDLARMALAPGQRRTRVISLTDNVAIMTAWANDVAYEEIFAEQLRGLAQPGDLVIAISGSGKSANVLKAIQTAKEIGMTTVAFTGAVGSPLEEMVDVTVAAPARCIEQAEDAHLIIEHAIAVALRQALRLQEPVLRVQAITQHSSNHRSILVPEAFPCES